MDPIALLVAAGVPQRFAKAVAYAILAVAVLLVLWAAKCTYDRNLIKTHDATQAAATANADRKADTNAADQRRVDDARLTNETTQTQEAVNEARHNGTDARAGYYHCIELQQAARRSGKQPPTCN